jgi:Tfp pilus assembly protein PilO
VSFALWRERWHVWVPALAFLLVNLALLSTYRFGYAGRVEALEARLERESARWQELVARRQALEQAFTRAGTNHDRVAELYQGRLAPERLRLTRMIAEVKDLAVRAGLEPEAISYPEQQYEKYGLIRKSFVFGVEGTYQALRQLINLLEVSDSFLTLEQVALSEASAGGRLRINLRLSTLFATEDEKPAAAAPAAASAPPAPAPAPGAPPAPSLSSEAGP